MPNAHILCGITCSGKTPYAREHLSHAIINSKRNNMIAFMREEGFAGFQNVDYLDVKVWSGVNAYCRTNFVDFVASARRRFRSDLKRAYDSDQDFVADSTQVTTASRIQVARTAQEFGFNVIVHEFLIDIDTAAARAAKHRGPYRACKELCILQASTSRRVTNAEYKVGGYSSLVVHLNPGA